MNLYEFILRKKRGGEHSEDDIREMIGAFTRGEIPDYQVSAWAMAVCFRGMTEREATVLTLAMAESGDTVDLSALGETTVDKHSTGGVGDKTTLLVAPIAAAAGVTVAKMSGRGLGHTGGTVDKLESFRGFRTELSGNEFLHLAREHGIVVVGQSGNLTPADKRLYALRDVTATVDSVPLIASSIMSKKLASGAKSIVLDVKFGSGAFFPTEEAAAEAAALMVKIGRGAGRRVSAVLSDMDAPLGKAIGNAIEVREAIGLLSGKASASDLCEISLTLSAELISLGLGISYKEGRARAEEALASGAAFSKFRTWIGAQGGDVAAVDDPSLLPTAPLSRTVFADESGYLTKMNAAELGMSALLLGAGRETKESAIDHGAGIFLLKKPGDRVLAGEPIAKVYAASEERLAAGAARFSAAVTYGSEPPAPRPLVARVLR